MTFSARSLSLSASDSASSRSCSGLIPRGRGARPPARGGGGGGGGGRGGGRGGWGEWGLGGFVPPPNPPPPPAPVGESFGAPLPASLFLTNFSRSAARSVRAVPCSGIPVEITHARCPWWSHAITQS